MNTVDFTTGADWTFQYDANGNIPTWVCASNYAVMGGVVRKTYHFNGQAVAVKNGATLEYLLSDHLGSASVSTSITGTLLSE